MIAPGVCCGTEGQSEGERTKSRLGSGSCVLGYGTEVIGSGTEAIGSGTEAVGSGIEAFGSGTGGRESGAEMVGRASERMVWVD